MQQEIESIMESSDTQYTFDLPVNTDIMFSDHKNIYKKDIENRRRKLLQKASFIKPFLHENETILCITTGCSPAPLIEQFLTGWIIFYLKRSLFIFTNERIFHIPTKHDFSYRNSIAQILYTDCQSITVKGRTLTAEYRNGKKEKFFYIPSGENKKIKNLLRLLAPEGRPGPTMERTHLCPRCTNTLIKDQYVCPTCALEFKDKEQTKKISLLYPGGGYFYTGHPIIGLGDAVTEIYLTLLLLLVSISSLNDIASGLPTFIFITIILTLEKILTVYHSNNFIKEYIPRDRSVEVVTTIPEEQYTPPPAPQHNPQEILSAACKTP
ncbi:MAG: hypothetical protein JW837_06715 [Sedimentisphaerales bacterium]|nr:hypothetical protein [Sedimentisphaerales bacterium]